MRRDPPHGYVLGPDPLPGRAGPLDAEDIWNPFRWAVIFFPEERLPIFVRREERAKRRLAERVGGAMLDWGDVWDDEDC